MSVWWLVALALGAAASVGARVGVGWMQRERRALEASASIVRDLAAAVARARREPPAR